MERKRYTQQELVAIRSLRQKYKPEEIALIVKRTPSSIARILSIMKKNGAEFPKLKHGNRKYDKQSTLLWRTLVKTGIKYTQIKQQSGVHPSVISRTLAAEARGEIVW